MIATRPVVDELDRHARREHTALDRHALGFEGCTERFVERLVSFGRCGVLEARPVSLGGVL
jgi:hypothetical protein